MLSLILLAFSFAPADEVDLLPPPDLKGWSKVQIPVTAPPKPIEQWKVDTEARTITCSGLGGHEWLKYDTEVGDFELHVEFRFTPREGNPRYNSGIGFKMSPNLDLWLQGQTGPTGGYMFGLNWADGGIQRVNLLKEMKENRIKPAGEWNTYDIKAVGDTVTLGVNGMVVNELKNVGYRKGYIGLEAEGFEITFRNIKLKKLN